MTDEELEDLRIFTGAATSAKGLVWACRQSDNEDLVRDLRKEALMAEDILASPTMDDDKILGVMAPVVKVIRKGMEESSKVVDTSYLHAKILAVDPEEDDMPLEDEDELFVQSKECFKQVLLLNALYFKTATDEDRMESWPYCI